MAGLTDQGFVTKRLADLLTDLQTAARGKWGDGVNLDADGELGMMIGLVADALSTVWGALQALYDAFNPANAQGTALGNLADLRGLIRQPATHSTAPVLCTGTVGVVIQVDKLVADDQGNQWRVVNDAITIGGGGTGTGTVQCTESGSIEALDGTIDAIVTPVSGWTAVESTADAEPGDDVETDAELLERMRTAKQGTTTLDGIITKLAKLLTEATHVDGVENATDTVDGDGRPAHSVEIVLAPDTLDTDDVAAALWVCKGAGTNTHGTTSDTATDVKGRTHTLSWTWVSEIKIKAEITLEVDADYPADGDDQVADLVVAFIEALDVGEDVTPYEVGAAFGTVPGIVTAVVELAEKPAAVSAAPVTVAYDQKPTVETPASDIVVNSSVY